MKNFLTSTKLQPSKGYFYRQSLIIILIVTSLPSANKREVNYEYVTRQC